MSDIRTNKAAHLVPVLSLNVLDPSVADARKPSDSALRERLSQELREWAHQETAGWDARVEGQTDRGSDAAEADLWGSMPVLDSKAVARTSPIFEKHLERPLDIKRIRPGGYDSVDSMIHHLVPAMMDDSRARGGVRAVKQEVDS